MTGKKSAVFFALLAAALYAVNIPLSKLLEESGALTPAMLAGFLYCGAGVGMSTVFCFKRIFGFNREEKLLCRKDMPYTVAMVVLDIAAPVLLMFGIAETASANVSLLNNFEIVATSLVAFTVFREKISLRMWAAIVLVVAASVILGFESADSFKFSRGSGYVLLACICWGVENNCTRKISDKSPQEIVMIKGIFSGAGGVAVAFIAGEKLPEFWYILAVMLLGFVSYGLSISFYITAQKSIGAAKTSAFYSVAPFLGVGFSFVIVGERPKPQFYLALAVMLISTVIMVRDTLGGVSDSRGYSHTHTHRHGGTVHSHEHSHIVPAPLNIHFHSHTGTKI